MCAGQYGAGYPAVAELLLDWGVQAELVLGAAERAAKAGAASSSSASGAGAANAAYLGQKLHFSEDGTKLLDADGGRAFAGACGAGGRLGNGRRAGGWLSVTLRRAWWAHRWPVCAALRR